jgi:hypothetical protein
MENLEYLKGLIKRIEDSVKIVKKAESPDQISEQERLTHPVLKEMQMVTPRVWDDYIRVTRDRRREIAEGK